MQCFNSNNPTTSFFFILAMLKFRENAQEEDFLHERSTGNEIIYDQISSMFDLKIKPRNKAPYIGRCM